MFFFILGTMAFISEYSDIGVFLNISLLTQIVYIEGLLANIAVN